MRSSGTRAPLRLRMAALTCSPRGLARQLRHSGHPLQVEAGVSCEEQGLTQTTGWQRPLQPCKPHSASLQRLSQNTHHGGFPKATGKHATLQVFQHNGYCSLTQKRSSFTPGGAVRLHQEQRQSTSSPTSRVNSSTRHPPPSPQPCFSRASFFLSAGHPTSAQASQDRQARGEQRAQGAMQDQLSDQCALRVYPAAALRLCS